MRTARRTPSGKGKIRSLVRKGVRSDKRPRRALKSHVQTEPALCTRCDAIYANKVWRRGRELSYKELHRAEKVICPACTQVRTGTYFGRIQISGEYTKVYTEEIKARIRNVVQRAQFTQPERRLISMQKNDDGFEIKTTSEKLAHRIVREIEKAFGGESSYSWSDRDGKLEARWHRDDLPALKEGIKGRRRKSTKKKR
jgi:NMD protein affecting ribosome stability and mRNA decay